MTADNIRALNPAPIEAHEYCKHGCSDPMRWLAGPCERQCVLTEEFKKQSAADAKASRVRFGKKIGANPLRAVPLKEK